MKESVVIGAMRLAVEAGADDKTILSLLMRLLDEAPETNPLCQASTRLLIDTVKSADGEWVIAQA